MSLLFLAQPVDHLERAAKTERFGPNAKAYMAYDRLCRLYWQSGALFREEHELAAVCGLSVPSFRRVRNLVSSLFRVDDTGLWRDLALERERAAAIVAAGLDPADFAPPPAPAPGSAGDAGTRSPRSIAGQRNAEERWARERARQAAELAAREAVVAERERRVAADERGAVGIAVGMPVGIVSHANAMPIGLPTDANSHAVGIDLARSHLARPLDEEEDEDSRRSSSSSSSKPSRTSDADAAPDANRHAKSAAGAMPTGDAKPPNGAATSRAHPALSDVELRDALVSAIGGKVEPGCREPHQVGPIRALMAEGCDLDLHILPELRALASSSKPLKTWRAPFLRDQIRARRDRPAEAARGPLAAEPPVFVAEDAPEWSACQDREAEAGRKRKRPIPNGRTGQKGAWFPTPLPPAARPSIAAE